MRGYKRAFGTDTVPGICEDLATAELIVLVGSNLAWCDPVLYQRIAAAKAAGQALKVVKIDPRAAPRLTLLTCVWRAGMVPFSVTGQANIMGGREVGGLADTLACHPDFADADASHRAGVARFRRAPGRPKTDGLKAVEMFGAVADRDIRAPWVIGTNPAVSLPAADAVRNAIAGCGFVVVSDFRPRPIRPGWQMWSCRRPAGGKHGTVTIPSDASTASAPALPALAKHATTGKFWPMGVGAWAGAPRLTITARSIFRQ